MAFCLGRWALTTGTVPCWRTLNTEKSFHQNPPIRTSFQRSWRTTEPIWVTTCNITETCTVPVSIRRVTAFNELPTEYHDNTLVIYLLVFAISRHSNWRWNHWKGHTVIKIKRFECGCNCNAARKFGSMLCAGQVRTLVWWWWSGGGVTRQPSRYNKSGIVCLNFMMWQRCA